MKKNRKLNDRYNINKRISISIGVYENTTDDLTQCIKNVDNSLYKEKESRKNCISVT